MENLTKLDNVIEILAKGGAGSGRYPAGSGKNPKKHPTWKTVTPAQIDKAVDSDIERIKSGSPLINLRDDYRIQEISNNKFSISAPKDGFTKFKTDEKGAKEFLKKQYLIQKEKYGK